MNKGRLKQNTLQRVKNDNLYCNSPIYEIETREIAELRKEFLKIMPI
jgi:hypothetical protein